MAMPLAGKTALITGSTRQGIGATTAIALAAQGANIVLNYGTGSKDDKARQRAAALQDTIQQMGRDVLTVEAAVDVESEVREMFRLAASRFGAVDILVNNASGTWREQDFAALATTQWDMSMRTDVNGTFFCIREALPLMRERRWGRIINICLHDQTMQMLVDRFYSNSLDKFPYDFSIAKYAKCHIARSLSALPELKYAITVNNILPGIIEEMSNEEAKQLLEKPSRTSPWFSPVDVADAVVFLCSDQARGITGSDLLIPGNVYQRLQ